MLQYVYPFSILQSVLQYKLNTWLTFKTVKIHADYLSQIENEFNKNCISMFTRERNSLTYLTLKTLVQWNNCSILAENKHNLLVTYCSNYLQFSFSKHLCLQKSQIYSKLVSTQIFFDHIYSKIFKNSNESSSRRSCKRFF